MCRVRATNSTRQTSANASRPGRPKATCGMPEMPTSPPSAACLRTMPTNRKLTPMVVIARKSWRTLSEVMPTTSPMAPAIAAAGTSATASGTPALVSIAAV